MAYTGGTDTLAALSFTATETKCRAMDGGFVDLKEFLPIVPVTSEDYSQVTLTKDGDIFRHTRTRYQDITCFYLWLQAWNRYERVLMARDNLLYSDLVSYRELIQKCNSKFHWQMLYTYDQKFWAQLAADESFKFGVINHDLYTTLFDSTAVRQDIAKCHRCQSVEHRVKYCPFPKEQPPAQKAPTPSLRWHALEGCRNQSTDSWNSATDGQPNISYGCEQISSLCQGTSLCSVSSSPRSQPGCINQLSASTTCEHTRSLQHCSESALCSPSCAHSYQQQNAPADIQGYTAAAGTFLQY